MVVQHVMESSPIPFLALPLCLTLLITPTAAVPLRAISARHDDPTHDLSQSIVLSYILLVAAALQIRPGILWSQSRMLRKLRAFQEQKKDIDITRDAFGTHPVPHTIHHIFSRLYISLSKGRHRRLQRVFSFLFYLFLFSIDILDTIPTTQLPYETSSDVIDAFRLTVYWGSTTVLGARPFSFMEAIAAALICILYAISIILFAGRPRVLNGTPRIVVFVIRVTLASFVVLIDAWDLFQCFRSESNGIASMANAIRKKPHKLNFHQEDRFNQMRNIMYEETRCTTNSSHCREKTLVKYWRVNLFRDVIVPIMFLATNGLMWGAIDTEYVPQIVVVETFETFAWIMFVVNESQVEPRLLIELLRVSQSLVSI